MKMIYRRIQKLEVQVQPKSGSTRAGC